MQLLNFSAIKVYGYMDFDINFNSDLTFLIGVNGTGKTTVIRLINAILNLDITTLSAISFEKIILEYKKQKKIIICCWKESDAIKFSSSILEKSKIFSVYDDDIEDGSWRRYIEEWSDELYPKHSLGQLAHFIGLERNQIVSNRVAEDPWIRMRYDMHYVENDHDEYLAVGLRKTQKLIMNKYRQYRYQERKIDEKMKRKILQTMFEYSSIDESFSTKKTMSIISKRKTIEKEFKEKRLLDGIALKNMTDFFDKLENSQKESRDKESFGLEYLLNKNLLDRIGKVVSLIEDNRQEIDKIYRPVTLFSDAINSFFVETGKEITIDPRGDISLQINKQKIEDIDILSSGEQQILVLLSMLAFENNFSRKKIFLIDEPELSLHLMWQRNFVRSIQKVAPNAQLILATHSPEIVAEYRSKMIEIPPHLGEQN